MSLFGSSAVTNNSSRRVLLTLRAGTCEFANGTVTPDPRAGILTLCQETSGLVELRWEPANGKGSALVVPIVAGEAKVDRVDKVTTGRVVVVDFGARQNFFWLQDHPDTERDAQYLKQLKTTIEGKGAKPGAAAASGSSRTATAAAAAAPAAAASSGGSSTGAPAAGPGGFSVDQLQQLLRSMGSAPTAPASAGGAAASGSAAAAPANPAEAARRALRLGDVLRGNTLRAALNADPAFYMTRLHATLPAGVDPSDDITPQVLNPQFSAAASALDAALQDPVGVREIATAFNIRIPPGELPSAAALLAAIAAEPVDAGAGAAGAAGAAAGGASADAAPK